MPRRAQFPAYPAKPHASGQARIRYRGRDYYLGVWDTPASRQEYARLAVEFSMQAPEMPALRASQGGLTVTAVIARWVVQARHERGKDNLELREKSRACTVLDRLYGATPAAQFDAKALGLVRQAMVTGAWMTEEEKEARRLNKMPIGWCRSQCNHMVNRIRTVWRWAETEGHVPKGSWDHLRALGSLPRHGLQVRQTRPRQPATWEQVMGVLPRVPPSIAAMILLQWWTGMRPSEVTRMKFGDVRKDGPEGTWLYTLQEHKSVWRDGEESIVVLGPPAIAALAPWLGAAELRGPEAYLFVPARTKLAACYSAEAYNRAIARACADTKTPKFSPYCLRHSAKRRITRELGLDAARALLRQKSLDVANSYDRHQDLDLAVRAARLAG